MSPSFSSPHSRPVEERKYTCLGHPHLTGTFLFICSYVFSSISCTNMSCFPARPCAKDGTFLCHPILKPEPAHPPDSTPDNPWAPFEDRIAFEWAYERYVKLQASKRQIKQGLDLWSAILLKGKSKSEVPWKSAEQLYDTIDSIEAGNAPWSTYEL